MVIEQIDQGAALIEALRKDDFETAVAFWAKLSDGQNYHLYLALPVVSVAGEFNAYLAVQRKLRQMPELGLDPLEVRVLDPQDSMAVAAAEILKPKVAVGPFAVANPKPYPGMTRYGGSKLGGMEIDGAYIYPPPRAAVTA